MAEKVSDKFYKQPVFSIIIPHYNRPEKLKRLIDSIPRRSDIEIIVVDDGSTEYVHTFERFRDNPGRGNVFFFDNHARNKGAGGARNLGVQNARGKWLIFADSDDYFTEGFEWAIYTHKDSEADIVYFDVTSQIEGSTRVGTRHKNYSKRVHHYLSMGPLKQYREKYLRMRQVTPWAKMIKRSFVEKYALSFEVTPVANDIMFGVMSGCYAKKIEADDVVVYCVEEGRNSLTVNQSPENKKIRAEVAERYAEFTMENCTRNELLYIKIMKYTLEGLLLKKITGKR